MPFANIKLPEAALTAEAKAELIHAVTDLFCARFGETVRPHCMVLIEEVKDGGYGRADDVFVIPPESRARG
ncbi:MAG: 4-oxalocrotonate tautomerase family protein [Pseudomonadota bacterium]|nr:4-oxalocrotonate tautomerase family protein [Pseudomonadota bacterium]